MNTWKKLWLLVLILFESSSPFVVVEALKVTGTIKGSDSWKYVTRFCFLPADTATGADVQGMLKATFKFKEKSHLTLMEYLERSTDYPGENVKSFDAWKDVYTGDGNCTERMSAGMPFHLWDPQLANACNEVYFRGRVGTNSGAMNGRWEAYTDPNGISTFGGRKIYSKYNGNDMIFLFFKGNMGVWYMAKEVGSTAVIAQSYSQAMSPADTDGTWSIADGEASFEQDPLVEAVCIDGIANLQNPDDFFTSPPPPPPFVEGYEESTGSPDTSSESTVVSVKGDEERYGVGLVPDDEGYVTAERTQFFVDDEARWIFLALANCDQACELDGGRLCQGPLDVEYTLELTNGDGWNVKHFSADEIGILETEIVFFALQLLLLVFGLFVRLRLVAIQKFHHTVKVLLASIALTFLANFFDLIHYCKFAADGEGSPGLHIVSLWLSGVAETLLLLLIILVAKGWSICCRKLSATGRMKISIYTTLYISALTGLMFWYSYAISSAEVVFIYHSAPGYILCCLRFFGIIWLMYSTYVTLKKFRTKRRFYKKFVALYSVWLAALPFIVLVALGVPTWIRAKVVTALELSFTFLAQAITLALYLPSTYNRSFPFHATTQDMLPQGVTRRVIANSNVPAEMNESATADDEEARRKRTFGNTRVVNNAMHASRLERAALRSALELAMRMASDVESLKGALESLEATGDDNDEDLHDDETNTHEYGVPLRTFSRPMGGRAAQYANNNAPAEVPRGQAINNLVGNGASASTSQSRNVSASQERSYIGRNFQNAFSTIPKF